MRGRCNGAQHPEGIPHASCRECAIRVIFGDAGRTIAVDAWDARRPRRSWGIPYLDRKTLAPGPAALPPGGRGAPSGHPGNPGHAVARFMGPLFRGASAFKNPRRAAGNYLSRAPHRTESVDLSYEELGKLLLRFRKSRYFRPFYLAVLGIVVLGLYWFTAGSQVTFCLGVLLIPAAALVIPYWLGERSLKNFAVNALPIFVIGLLLVAASTSIGSDYAHFASATC